jgi:hypothetical protein
MHGGLGITEDKSKAGTKNEKFLKTQKKLPDLKGGQEGLNPKNMTFSSDSEDPNLVRVNVLLSLIGSFLQFRILTNL